MTKRELEVEVERLRKINRDLVDSFNALLIALSRIEATMRTMTDDAVRP